MPMKKPAHPGQLVKDNLESLGLSASLARFTQFHQGMVVVTLQVPPD